MAFESARMHLVVYTAILAFQNQYNWPDPIATKIPLPRSQIAGFITTFSQLVNKDPSTPKDHTRIIDVLSKKSPSKSPSKSPAKSGRKLSAKLVTKTESSVKRSLNDELVAVSDFTGEVVIPKAFAEASSGSPTKRPRRSPTKKSYSDSEYDEDDDEEVRRVLDLSGKGKRKSKAITSHTVVTICNNCYIPEQLTRQILVFYSRFYFNQSSHWGFLIGLVAVVYSNLNAREVLQRPELKRALLSNLHKLQSGGLTLDQIGEWVSKVQSTYGDIKWIRYASYDNQRINDNIIGGFASLGSFLQHDYLSEKYQQQWDMWRSDMQKYVNDEKDANV